MIEGKSVLGIIVARGGSKGLPGKNIAPLGGKPLVAWSVEAGQGSRYLDRLILSSDNTTIIEAALTHGCEAPFVRPPELATDTAGIHEVLLHALDNLEQRYDYLVLLQATSPFRSSHDIDRCLEICLETGAPACVSFTEPGKAPWIMYTLDEQQRIQPLFPDYMSVNRRQELPHVYAPNGAVYVAETAWFRETGTFYNEQTRAWIMPPERSVDVDLPIDLIMADALIRSGLLPDMAG